MGGTGTSWSTSGDIHFRQSTSDPQVWEYLPRSPGLRRDPAGHPMVTLHELGDEGYLMLTATWGGPEAELEALRSEIAARVATEPGRVRLAFASVSGPRCDLLVGDGPGTFTAVASSATSGNPPYDALFAVTVRAQRLAAARAATTGAAGRLLVEYRAELAGPVTACADIGSIIAKAAHRGDPDATG